MRNITLLYDDINKGDLILVNGAYPMIQRQTPASFSMVQNSYNITMQTNASKLLSHLFEAVNCKNDIVPVSGYRSPEEQSEIYKTSLAENGQEFTKAYIALPHHSEHQTGLAIDLALKQEEIDFIRPYFPYDGICHEFRKLAPHYGFIERYPQGKENITGIAHEPWHFRFVGFPHSKIITEENITLEEYIEYLKLYPYGGKHLYIEHRNQIIEVFYVCISNMTSKKISIKDNLLYQVSGNNVDGVIFTNWRERYE